MHVHSRPTLDAPIALPSYQVLRRLGEGHNAVVYQAYRIADPERRPLALKVFKQLYPSPGQLARLRHEIGLLQRLRSPYLAPALGLEEDGGLFIIVSRYEALQSLREWLDGRPCSTDEFLGIALQVTRALEDIHRQGVMHGDLKPSNILISADAQILKLTDFGMSRSFERDLGYYPPELYGTLPYISPEQTGRTNKPVDYRSDFYSLGVTLFELATGRLPFEIDDRLSLIHAHLAVEPPSASALNPALPQPLGAIIARLMAKNSDERYQSAAALRADLERCQAEWRADGAIAPFALGSADQRDRLVISHKLYQREADLQRLIELLDRIGQDTPALALVSGAPGIGKSALIQASQPAVVARRGMFVADKYDQYQREEPYGALVRALRTLLRRILREPPDVIQAWRAALQAAVGDNGRVVSEAIPETEPLLGPQPVVPDLPPQQARGRFDMVFGAFLRACGRPDQPLVLFLDDLQWVDRNSLEFLQAFLSDPQPAHLLLLGAYRENEVTPGHGLTRLLAHLEGIGRPAFLIRVTLLELPAVTRLLADTLGDGNAAATPATSSKPAFTALARALHRKSEGNPFFLNTLLQTLYDDRLLTYAPDQGWRWAPDALDSTRLSDDVVDLLTLKLERLPEATLEALKQAACLGNSVALETLGIAGATELDVLYTHLEPAMRADLLRDEGAVVRFVHDRVQEAVYRLMKEGERRRRHWEIGRRLLAVYDEPVLEEQLFLVVNQLNQGRELLGDDATRTRLVELNYRAGLKARANTAFDASLTYLEMSRDLLPAGSWDTNYEQTYAVWYEVLAANALLTNQAAGLGAAEVLLAHARSPRDRARCYWQMMRLHTSQRNYRETLAAGNQALALLGQALPDDPRTIQGSIAAEMLYLFEHISGPEVVLNLPEMTEPVALALMDIHNEMTAPLYIRSLELMTLNQLLMVRTGLAHGCHPALISAFIALAVGFIAQGQVKQALSLSTISDALWDRYPKSLQTARAIAGFAWTRSMLIPDLDALRRQNQRGQILCKNVGEMLFCGVSMHLQILADILEGRDLDATLANAQAIRTQLTQWQQSERPRSINLIIAGYLKPLLGLETVELAALEQELMTLERKNPAVRLDILQLHILNGIARYILGRYAAALDHLTRANEYLSSDPVGPLILPWHIYHALTLLALAQETPNPENLEQAEALLTRVETLTEYTSIYRPYTALIRAELAYARHDPAWHSAFIAAIERAAAADYTLLRAIINERLARHLLAAGHRFARGHLEEARYLYEQCGAKASAQQLLQTYALHIQPAGVHEPGGEMSSPSESAGGSSLQSDLDLYAILKASQAISGEIDLERLLAVVMRTIGEVSGAESAYLILEQQHEPVIRARYHAGARQPPTEIGAPLPVRGGALVSERIVYYVQRTRQALLLDDACNIGEYRDDPSIQARGVRSVLCHPLIEQHRLAGIIYLENTLSSHTFTPARVEVVRLLATQAAISLTNVQAVDLKLRNTRLEGLLQFARFLQHELRGYTAGLEGITPLLRQLLTAPTTTEPSPEEREQLAVAIEETVEQMQDLTQQLLILTREGTLPDQQRRALRLAPLLEQARTKAGAVALRHALTPEIAMEATPDLQVVGDPLSLALAIFTGLRNAIEAFDRWHARDERARIALRAQAAGDMVAIRIEDNGPGFPPDLLAAASAAERSALIGWSSKAGGSGLGLPLMERVARLHEGGFAFGNREGEPGAWVELTIPALSV